MLPRRNVRRLPASGREVWLARTPLAHGRSRGSSCSRSRISASVQSVSKFAIQHR